MNLVNLKDAAKLINKQPSGLIWYRNSRNGFPKPAKVVGRTKYYDADEVVKWWKAIHKRQLIGRVGKYSSIDNICANVGLSPSKLRRAIKKGSNVPEPKVVNGYKYYPFDEMVSWVNDNIDEIKDNKKTKEKDDDRNDLIIAFLTGKFDIDKDDYDDV
jgi:predicted DNA-binding transcriptional regulator AlpA